MPERVVVGISGSTGVVYAIELLKMLREHDIETHVVMSRAARLTLAHESDWTVEEVADLAHTMYPPNDIGAAIASGSFLTRGMIVAPCSVKTVAQIAMGNCDSLLPRAADVALKERRRLVLMVRETPLSLIHLRNMVAVTEAGAVVAPPMPPFYTRPDTIDDIVRHSVNRMLDLLGIVAHNYSSRWDGNMTTRRQRERAAPTQLA
ncbi:UbiX family flavin prenyltransferase [Micromonospora fulviviridis]|uniref:Flavin prenyltransferase UbiX n=1 Tax=Micromonospora fulviviridis TaxID=47860 RepID=A0ABV2VUU7_9ACTN